MAVVSGMALLSAGQQWLAGFRTPRNPASQGQSPCMPVPFLGDVLAWCSGVVAGSEGAPMVRAIGYSLAFGAAAAGVAIAGWPGSAANPATLLTRVDVIATLVTLAAVSWAAHRIFGPVGNSRPARIVRIGGYLLVFVVILVKAEVARTEYAAMPGGSWLAGLWLGEFFFLVLLAAYVTGLVALTARRPFASTPSLAIGTGVGAAVGLLTSVLQVGNPPHGTSARLEVLHGWPRIIAAALLLAAVVAAGLAAARRAPRRGSELPLADVRARQGVATGLCAGGAAALFAAIVGIAATALLPHQQERFQWPVPSLTVLQHVPSGVYEFRIGLGNSAAGYLLVLALFPLLGAGLGAWGGLSAAGRPGRRSGGGGGGGGGGQGPTPAGPPPDGRRLDGDGRPAMVLDGHRLLDFPVPDGLPLAPEGERAPAHREREKVPVGAAGRMRS